MTSDEIIRAAKAASEPALHRWIDYTWDTCRDSIADEDDPVQTLIDWARVDAENDDWELPADRQQREEKEAEAGFARRQAQRQAVQEAVELVTALIGGLDYLEISDHPAPEYGGFDPERQERRGRADCELIVTPGEPTDLEPMTRFLESQNQGRME